MRINIAATKTNLLNVKKSLVLTTEGHELLDEKRKILLNELTSVLHVVNKLQNDLDEALIGAYEIADKAIVTTGRKKVEELSFSININNEISISNRRIMGVTMPVINLAITEHPPYYSPYEVSFYVDEVIKRFKGILELITQLAEKKITLLRLAKELQKTMRKVNALEKIYIPYYRDAFKSISDRLDEASRESFSMLKLIKEKIKK